jgi:hypothetical protein
VEFFNFLLEMRNDEKSDAVALDALDSKIAEFMRFCVENVVG